jgi:TolB-like protein/Tfp pilus assembly protein PilF
MQFKGVNRSLPDIARQLNVEAVVEGSVLRAGDRVRITAQLVHASTDEHLWAESYDRDVSDVLRLQSEVARTIAREIRITLTPQEQARMADARPVNPEAYQAYLKGRFHWNKLTAEGFRKAVDSFQEAVSLAPDWPLGYAGLADAYVLMPAFSTMRPSEAIPKARAAAERAIKIDESLAEPYGALGHIASTYDWDWPTAERRFERALALSPNYAIARHWYARHLMIMGRYDEAIRESTQAQEVDPLSFIAGSTVGTVHIFAGDFQEAEVRLRKLLEIGPNFPLAHRELAVALSLQGRFADATTEAREASRLSNNESHYAASLGYVCGKAGLPDEARRILDELLARSKEAYVAPSSLARIYAGLGETDRMFEWWERGYQERDVTLVYQLPHPLFAFARSDPRFDDLIRRVGLPMPKPVPTMTPELPPAPRGDKGGVTDGKITLVVLPFENLSRDPEQEYFSDGLTEEMIGHLGRVNPERLAVIARTSAMHYKATDKSIAEIGRELGVEYLLEGSVRRSADRLRISAKLIRGSDQSQLWSEDFDRQIDDVFALQSDVAVRVTEALAVKLLPAAEAAMAGRRTVNPAAHEAYLKGLHHWYKFTEKGWYRAIDFFREALDLDPTYAPAYAGMARAYTALGIFYLSPEEAYPKAKSALLKALALDDSLAHAHSQLAAVVLFYEHDWTVVDREVRRALDLDPNASQPHDVQALYLAAMGRLDEALAAAKRAKSIDPLSALYARNVGWAYFNGRNYEQAIVYCRQALDLDPDFDFAHALNGWALIQQRRYDELLRQYADISNLDERNPGLVPPLVHAYAALGRKADADRVVDQLLQRSKSRYVDPAEIALSYLGLGDHDRAFEWLETAVQQRSAWWPNYLDVSPVFDPIRADPRFADLVRRVGLPLPQPSP